MSLASILQELNIFSKIRFYNFSVNLIPIARAHETGGYKSDVRFFLGHPVTLTLTFTMRYLEISQYMIIFLENYLLLEFLTDFNEHTVMSLFSSPILAWKKRFFFIKGLATIAGDALFVFAGLARFTI